MTNAILYQILPLPEKHLFEVHCIISDPDPAGQKLRMPAWIPGSYLIRDFAKHVVSISALANGQMLPIEMLDKQTWQLAPTAGPVKISYQIFALDLVPRGAHVDNTHAFFNGSRVFLQVLGQEYTACEVDIVKPLQANYQAWKVGTSLIAKTIKTDGFGRYWAENYDDLIDHPVEIGEFEQITFAACGVPHTLLVINANDQPKADLPRLVRDLKVICEHHIQFFGLPAPMDRYLFILNVLTKAYGGLEHRFSSVNHCDRSNLPKINEAEVVSESYRALLGLLSHEYFHTWNVKRLKPKDFLPYDLTQENYTRQLWIFEGITSYYDELSLIRSHRISKDSFFELLGQLMTRVLATPGRLKQTLAQSSFEAWTKFYKPDENFANANISYYTKGALVALGLDLHLREKTEHRCSLDTVMKAFWKKYGMSGQGVPERTFELLIKEVSDCDLTEFFAKAVYGTEDLSFEELFTPFGVKVNAYPAFSVEELGGKKPVDAIQKLAQRPLLEVRFKPTVTEAEIVFVWEGSAAEAAGLTPGDVIIAVDNFKVDRTKMEAMIANYAIGDTLQIQAFRREKLMTFSVTLRGGWLRTYHLTEKEGISEPEKQSLEAWLYG